MKVALIMDNCCPHGADISDIREQIETLTLPPNCTNVHQLMDMCIIAAWKKRYLYHILRQIMSELESRQELRDNCSSVLAGMRGMTEGFDPHILDVTSMVKDSWDEVFKKKILWCFIKAEV